MAKRVGLNVAYNLTMPPDWWEAADTLATSRGMNRSELFRALLIEALPASAARKLTEPAKRGRRAAAEE